MATKNLFARLVREPLVHFLVLGGLLFVLYDAIGTPTDEGADRTIVVHRESLKSFFRLRSKAIGAEAAEQLFDSMSVGDLAKLVDEFVREEALYREAKSMQLDEKDQGVRNRLVGQIEFINQGIVGSSIELTDQQLREYLSQNEAKYRQPPTITFTHVFFSSDRHGQEKAEGLAAEMLVRLNGVEDGAPVPFHQAPGYGDRFLYHQNYVNDEAEEIRSHFGPAMQRQLFSLEPRSDLWRGPFPSRYGFHLVLLTKKTDGFLPDFQQLRRRLEADAYQQRMDQELGQLEQGVVQSYQVILDDELQSRLGNVY